MYEVDSARIRADLPALLPGNQLLAVAPQTARVAVRMVERGLILKACNV